MEKNMLLYVHKRITLIRSVFIHKTTFITIHREIYTFISYVYGM